MTRRGGTGRRQAAGLAGLVLLAGCHAAHAGGAPATPTTSVTGSVTDAVTVGRTVADPVTGDAVTVQSVGRRGAVLLVEVRAVAGTRFGRGVAPSALSVVATDDAPTARVVTPADLPVFTGTQAGQSTTGWLAFTAPDDTALSLRLTRTGFAVVGSPLVIPAAAFTVPLPVSPAVSPPVSPPGP
jgi:hypothetical protein